MMDLVEFRRIRMFFCVRLCVARACVRVCVQLVVDGHIYMFGRLRVLAHACTRMCVNLY